MPNQQLENYRRRQLVPDNSNTAVARIDPILQIEREATERARASYGTKTPNVYSDHSRTTKISPEREFAAQIEASPELYGEFRNRHNSAATIRALQAAGVKVSFE